MDIIWRAFLETLASLVRKGLAFAIVIFAFIVLALTALGVDKAFANESYYRDHGWPKLLAMVIAATPIYLVGRYVDSRSGAVAADQQAEYSIVVGAMRASSRALKVWPVILVIFGIVMLFF